MNKYNLFSEFRTKRRSAKGLKNEEKEWIQRNYASPSLAHIKRAVILREGYSEAIWVETGTFMGDTTALLSKEAKEVFTIEPERTLYEQAVIRFQDNCRVNVIHGLSETIFPSLLPKINGVVNFWLDGHYSGGVTHQGPIDCPVRDELFNIEKNLERFEKVAVLIDDIRCFDPSISEYKDYPSVDYLVDWARANNLYWHIEHDIFIAKSKR